MTRPAIFSFFSGIGLLDLGFEHGGFDICYVNEFHGPFLDAYRYARAKLALPEPAYGYFPGSIDSCLTGEQGKYLAKSVKAVRSSGRPFGFIGGPPCPDFSVGGKNRGRHGDNGRLSQSFIDLVCKQKPDFFLFENVKGLWRTKKHRAFYDELKNKLAANGYSLTDKLVNAIEFGSPQDRDRILLFGVRQEFSPKASTDETLSAAFGWTKHMVYPGRSAFSFRWPGRDESSASDETPPKELTVQYWFARNAVEAHPNSAHGFKPRAGLARFISVREGDDSRKSFKRLHRLRYSPTAAYGNNEVHIHPTKARRITAAEALAIQSLPAEFQLPSNMTLSNMFKAIGNGVPYLAALNIAKTIGGFLIDADTKAQRKQHR